jgi:prolyl-tRNA editing enzyme YbaK/EbsC (Cys-tRNA(Pro) deacylase)
MRRVSVERVRDALRATGLEVEIRSFRERTSTAHEAATAIGTSVARIVKSLVFLAGDEFILVLASGPNRVDTSALERLLGQPVTRADADSVRGATGFAVGGVPPLGLAQPLPVYIDRDLHQYDQVWASAGTPHSVFAIAPNDLTRLTGGTVADLKAR